MNVNASSNKDFAETEFRNSGKILATRHPVDILYPMTVS